MAAPRETLGEIANIDQMSKPYSEELCLPLHCYNIAVKPENTIVRYLSSTHNSCFTVRKFYYILPKADVRFLLLSI